MKAIDAPMIMMSKNNVFCIVFEATTGVNVENVLKQAYDLTFVQGFN